MLYRSRALPLWESVGMRRGFAPHFRHLDDLFAPQNLTMSTILLRSCWVPFRSPTFSACKRSFCPPPPPPPPPKKKKKKKIQSKLTKSIILFRFCWVPFWTSSGAPLLILTRSAPLPQRGFSMTFSSDAFLCLKSYFHERCILTPKVISSYSCLGFMFHDLVYHDTPRIW